MQPHAGLPPEWALERVPGAESPRREVAISRLAGGSVNEVWRVATGAGEFVLRLNGADWKRPGVDRQRELALHRAAAGGGVAPPIVAADPAREGLLICAFQSGRLWTASDYGSRPALHRLGERLQVLHALAPPPVAPFDPWSVALAYLQAIRSRDPAAEMPPWMLQRLESACAELAQARLAPCIAHGDLMQSNLVEGRRLWLLDWEYAQCADAYMDIACVMAYYPESAALAPELLAAAGLRQDRTILAPRLFIYRALSWLWHRARGETVAVPEN